MYTKVIAIDPVGCGCIECLTGEYVPLDQATDEQISDMICLRIRNNTYIPDSEIVSWLWADRSDTIARFRSQFIN